MSDSIKADSKETIQSNSNTQVTAQESTEKKSSLEVVIGIAVMIQLANGCVHEVVMSFEERNKLIEYLSPIRVNATPLEGISLKVKS